MPDTCLELTVDGAIAHIKFVRPERRNAMSWSFWEDLPAMIKQVEATAAVRAVVISSTGPHFSAGLDLSVFAQLKQESGATANGYALYQKIRQMQQSLSCLEECRVPVLAAVQGAAIGGAVDLLSACDMRYCTEDAYFCIEEINVGMTADVGTFPRLQKLIPEGLVRELAYTGRKMKATEARAVGYANAILPTHEALLEHVLGVAADIASKAPLAVYGCKKAINWGRDHSTKDGLDQMAMWNAGALDWQSIQEAITARAAGRAGEFPDLPVAAAAVASS